MSASRSSLRIPLVAQMAAIAVAVSGCGGPVEMGLFSDDKQVHDRVRNIRVEVTTIDAVTGEDYAAKAWQTATKPFKPPYHVLTEGELFGWALLDELAEKRKKSQLEAQKKAEAEGRKKEKEARAKLKLEKEKQTKEAKATAEESKKKAQASREAEAAKTEQEKKPVE